MKHISKCVSLLFWFRIHCYSQTGSQPWTNGSRLWWERGRLDPPTRLHPIGRSLTKGERAIGGKCGEILAPNESVSQIILPAPLILLVNRIFFLFVLCKWTVHTSYRSTYYCHKMHDNSKVLPSDNNMKRAHSYMHTFMRTFQTFFQIPLTVTDSVWRGKLPERMRKISKIYLSHRMSNLICYTKTKAHFLLLIYVL